MKMYSEMSALDTSWGDSNSRKVLFVSITWKRFWNSSFIYDLFLERQTDILSLWPHESSVHCPLDNFGLLKLKTQVERYFNARK